MSAPTALMDLAVALTTERPVDHLSAEHVTLLTELARFQIAAHEALRASVEPRSEAAANFAAQAERATQDMLRRALALGDRAPAVAPLRELAQRLGVTLDEAAADWCVLAFEALRVMLDASCERERREIGRYAESTPIFRSVMAGRSASRSPALPAVSAQPTAPVMTVPPASVPAEVAASAAMLHVTGAAAVPPPAALDPVRPEPAPAAPVSALRAETAPLPHDVQSNAAPTQVAAPTTGIACPASATAAQKRETRILIDETLLTETSRAALGKGPNIEFREAFDLYFELKELGYGDNFEARQKRFPDQGKNWKRTSGGNARKAREIWVDVLGNQPFQQIDWTEVDGVLNIIRRIPKYHGKKPTPAEHARFPRARRARRRTGTRGRSSVEIEPCGQRQSHSGGP